jgi:pyruvate kinase
MSRRAKIVATLGPASSSPERLAELVAAGIDVARLNMSHGTQAGHLAAYRCVRAASDAAGHSVGVLIDLQGPKIRLGTFAAGPVRRHGGWPGTGRPSRCWPSRPSRARAASWR